MYHKIGLLAKLYDNICQNNLEIKDWNKCNICRVQSAEKLGKCEKYTKRFECYKPQKTWKCTNNRQLCQKLSKCTQSWESVQKVDKILDNEVEEKIFKKIG